MRATYTYAELRPEGISRRIPHDTCMRTLRPQFQDGGAPRAGGLLMRTRMHMSSEPQWGHAQLRPRCRGVGGLAGRRRGTS